MRKAFPNVMTLSKILGTLMFTGTVTAGTMGGFKESPSLPWSVVASLGYGVYDDMLKADGQTPIGRLAMNKAVSYAYSRTWGIEVGVQNGNRMRLNVDPAIIDLMGGLPIQTTLKPMLDLLLTVRTNNFDLGGYPLFIDIKGGIAYQRWQFDNGCMLDLSRVSGEVQVGLGYQLNETASLSLLYQGVYGGSTNFRLNHNTLVGKVKSIPVENGILFSLAYRL